MSHIPTMVGSHGSSYAETRCHYKPQPDPVEILLSWHPESYIGLQALLSTHLPSGQEMRPTYPVPYKLQAVLAKRLVQTQ